MILPRDEAAEILAKMSPQKRHEVFDKIIKINSSSPSEVKQIFDSTSNDVRKVIGLLMVHFVEEIQAEERLEIKKEKAQEVRKDAIKILESLVVAYPDQPEDVLCDRAIRMAQRLHDHC
ncbi:MAG: hypothetical protein ACRC62_18380 [Microcoleus sp.]